MCRSNSGSAASCSNSLRQRLTPLLGLDCQSLPAASEDRLRRPNRPTTRNVAQAGQQNLRPLLCAKLSMKLRQSQVEQDSKLLKRLLGHTLGQLLGAKHRATHRQLHQASLHATLRALLQVNHLQTLRRTHRAKPGPKPTQKLVRKRPPIRPLSHPGVRKPSPESAILRSRLWLPASSHPSPLGHFPLSLCDLLSAIFNLKCSPALRLLDSSIP